MANFFIADKGISNIRTGNSKSFNVNPIKGGTLRKGIIPAQRLVTLGYVREDKGVKELGFYSAFRLWNGFKYVDVSASTLGYRYSSKQVSTARAIAGCDTLSYLIVEGRDIFVDDGEGDIFESQFNIERQEGDISGYHIGSTEMKNGKMFFTTKKEISTLHKYLILQSEETEDFKNEHELPEPNSYEYWAAKEPKLYAEWLVREQARLDNQGKGQKVHPELIKLAPKAEPKATTKKTTKKK